MANSAKINKKNPIFRDLSKKISDGFNSKINSIKETYKDNDKREKLMNNLALGAAGVVGLGAAYAIGSDAIDTALNTNSSEIPNAIKDPTTIEKPETPENHDNTGLNKNTIIEPKQDNFYRDWLKNHTGNGTDNFAVRYNGEYLTDLHKDLPWKIDRYADMDAIKKEYADNSYITNIIDEHSKEFEARALKEAQARAFDEYMETKASSEELAKYHNFLKNLGYDSYEDYVKAMNDKDPLFRALRKSNFRAVRSWLDR